MDRIYLFSCFRELYAWFKGLFLSFFDGSSFFPWDMSLHVEMGRNKKKPQEIALSNQQQKHQNITNNAITTKKNKYQIILLKTSLLSKILLFLQKQKTLYE